MDNNSGLQQHLSYPIPSKEAAADENNYGILVSIAFQEVGYSKTMVQNCQLKHLMFK